MKIAMVGAWGYGNVGDTTYPLIWDKYFPDQEPLVYYNSDNPWDGIESDCEMVVYGGGGLMWHSEAEAHFDYMNFYAKEAKRLGIPYGFISCDLQVSRSSKNPRTFDYDAVLAPWLPVLKEAAFLSVRSRNSVEILAERGVEAQYAPDLAYLFRPANVTKQRSLLTAIPAARFIAKEVESVDTLRRIAAKHEGARMIIMNMGGPDSDCEVDALGEHFPQATILRSEEVSPARALDIISRSVQVITGRYHGLVFSRTCGVPVITPPHSQYKIQNESPMPLDKDPWENILFMQSLIAKYGKD